MMVENIEMSEEDKSILRQFQLKLAATLNNSILGEEDYYFKNALSR